jgi:SnoaL-like domain
MRATLTLAVFSSITLALVACEDQATERKAIEQTLASLQQAYRDRDPQALLALVSETYRTDMGTPDPGDDLDYAALKQSVPATFAHAKQIEIDMQIQSIQISGDRARADCRQKVGYLLSLNGQETWSRHDDVVRIELARQDGRWKILSGL